MKKVMIAAAAAAMVIGAQAAVCGRSDTPTPTPAAGYDVYQIQMQLRSTWGAICGNNDITGGLCGRSTTNACGVLRVPQSWVIDGWLVACTNNCGSLQGATWCTWLKNARYQLDGKGKPSNGKFTFMNIFGQTGELAETLGTLSGTIDFGDAVGVAGKYTAKWDLQFAGQGVFDKGIKKYTSFLGYVTGSADKVYLIADDICQPALVWQCDPAFDACPAIQDSTAIYGRWALRYHADASAALSNKDNPVLPEVPSYVTMPDIK